MNNKGVSEIISQILLMLVTVVVVGIIIAAIVPQMSRGKSQIKFEESKLLRDNIFSSIQEVYNSPIGHTKEISLKLENLSLNIDGDTETIEIYSIIDGEFYKDGLRQEEGNGKYTYRNGQKLYAGFTLENIDIVRSYVLENQLNATIYLRKTDKDKIAILLENVIEDHWFTASNLGLYNETPSTWQYRKKILIDGNKVDGNLTNFPVLIYLNDFDLNLYAKRDGSDIIFTSKDGKTKLKREIEDYNSNSGALIAWVKIPELTTGADTPIYMYFGNSDANESNDKDVWDDDYVMIQQLNNTFTDSTINPTTCTNTSALPIEDRFNNNNSAMLFPYETPYPPTSNVRINCGNPDYLDMNNITISTWIYTFDYSVHYPIFVRKGDNYRTGLTGINGGNVFFRLVLDDGQPSRSLSSTSKVDINSWTQIVGTYDGDKLRIYIDGELNNTSSSYPGNILPSTNSLIIGSYDTSGNYSLNGKIDDVKISKIARSEEWIKTEYNNQSVPAEFVKVGILEKA